jgi:UDP-glucose 4-epimerase
MEPFYQMMYGHDGEIFNLGADRAYAINELAEVVGKTAWKRNLTPKIEHVEARHEVKHAYCDHKKAKNLLNFSDDTDLEELIIEMFDWAVKQPQREQKTMDYEVMKGIYDYWK